jgi:ABC-type thiamine transport system ATPase subunit
MDRASLECGAVAIERARSKLAQVGLSGFENRLPRALFGGQQQRVALGRYGTDAACLAVQRITFRSRCPPARYVRDEIRTLQQSQA